MVLAIGATAGKAFEVHGWELWGPLHDMFYAGDYEGVIAKGKAQIEAGGYPMPLYNLRLRREPRRASPRTRSGILGMAAELWDGFREMAQNDTDFRSDPRGARLPRAGRGLTPDGEREARPG